MDQCLVGIQFLTLQERRRSRNRLPQGMLRRTHNMPHRTYPDSLEQPDEAERQRGRRVEHRKGYLDGWTGGDEIESGKPGSLATANKSLSDHEEEVR